MAVKSEAPVYPAQGVADRLRDRKLQAPLHLTGRHPALLNHDAERDLDIPLGSLAQSMRPRRVQLVNQAEHAEQIGLRDPLFVQRDQLAFAQADYERLWS